jgi:hypothetical protein
MRVPPAVVNCQVLRELGRPWATVRGDEPECANVTNRPASASLLYDPV